MSVISDFQVSGGNPSTVGGTGTAVKYFPRTLGPSIGVAPSTPSSTSPVGMLPVPGDNRLNGQFFRIQTAGNIIAGAAAGSETASVQLYAVTGTLAAPTYTSIATTGTITPPVDGVERSWAITATLYGDTLSGLVGGSYVGFNNGVAGSATSTTAVLSGINFGEGNTGFGHGIPFGLVVGVTFSVSNSANSAKMYQLQLSAE